MLALLPPELILRVCEYLSPTETAVLGATCTALRTLTRDHLLWSSYYSRRWGAARRPDHPSQAYYDMYRARHIHTALWAAAKPTYTSIVAHGTPATIAGAGNNLVVGAPNGAASSLAIHAIHAMLDPGSDPAATSSAGDWRLLLPPPPDPHPALPVAIVAAHPAPAISAVIIADASGVVRAVSLPRTLPHGPPAADPELAAAASPATLTPRPGSMFDVSSSDDEADDEADNEADDDVQRVGQQHCAVLWTARCVAPVAPVGVLAGPCGGGTVLVYWRDGLGVLLSQSTGAVLAWDVFAGPESLDREPVYHACWAGMRCVALARPTAVQVWSIADRVLEGILPPLGATAAHRVRAVAPWPSPESPDGLIGITSGGAVVGWSLGTAAADTGPTREAGSLLWARAPPPSLPPDDTSHLYTTLVAVPYFTAFATAAADGSLALWDFVDPDAPTTAEPAAASSPAAAAASASASASAFAAGPRPRRLLPHTTTASVLSLTALASASAPTAPIAPTLVALTVDGSLSAFFFDRPGPLLL